MKSQDIRLGYLFVATPVNNVHIGGIMVVDGRGLPVEFRYTEPIQPTKIQQILYGAALSRYIKTDVILETLLKSLESKPHLLIVNDESFLLKDTATRDFDVVRLTETKSGPLKSGTGSIEQITATEFLLQLTAEGNPLRVQLSNDVPDTRDLGNAPKSLPSKSKDAETDFSSSKIYSILFDTGRVTDVIEPMQRVEKALTVLCQESGIKAAAN